MDVVDAATRSRMMAGIRGKNTSAEVALRRELHPPEESAREAGHSVPQVWGSHFRQWVLLAWPRLPFISMAQNSIRVLARQNPVQYGA
jgi:hypothetical protein